MTDSIYAPPETDVEVADVSSTPYYVVSAKKLVILSIITFNMYIVYWAYRHWAHVKRYFQEDVWPVPRALFMVFFTHSLFGRIDGSLRAKNMTYSWSPYSLATLVVLISVAVNILSRIGARFGDPLWIDLVALGSVFVLTALLVPAQRAANLASDDPEGESNSNLTAANWAWIVLGGAYWGVSMLGLWFLLTQGAA
ncbi:MAG: hypothetical protein AAF578_11760 [Pseudomonadota bacterium]